jgi:mitochondrial fission protein ELM1
MTQCLGVAAHFSPNPSRQIVRHVSRLRRFFARPIFGRDEQRPDLVVSCGRRSEQSVEAIRGAFRPKPFTVHLQPAQSPDYDLVFVSRHDWTDGHAKLPGHHPMIGVPHSMTMGRLAEVRQAARLRRAPAADRVAAVFVGGSNGAYLYDKAALEHLADSIGTLVEQGWHLLVSTSRRTEPVTLRRLLQLRSSRVEVWDGRADNPYLDYLAAADAFLIAKDSITMPCEALVTGRPVYSLDLTPVPGERMEKFERFHRDLQEELRLTRPFGGALEPYQYVPLNETGRIAGIIRETLRQRGAPA